MDELIKITPDKEKVKSILKMVETTLEMIKTIDKIKFPSNVMKEYYEIIRELISIVLLLDGYKTQGTGAHKMMIDYLAKNYEEFSSYEISFLNDLRMLRNKIAYDGFFVKEDFVTRNTGKIQEIITKLKSIINN